LQMIEQEKQILSKDKNDIANRLQEKEWTL
jgi:hypothetical protein